jgi:hypothetical protein
MATKIYFEANHLIVDKLSHVADKGYIRWNADDTAFTLVTSIGVITQNMLLAEVEDKLGAAYVSKAAFQTVIETFFNAATT